MDGIRLLWFRSHRGLSQCASRIAALIAVYSMRPTLNRASLAALSLTSGAILGPAAARADYLNPNVTVSESLSSIAQSSSVTLLDLGTAYNPGLVSSNTLAFSNPPANQSGTISFAGKAGVYAGTAPGTAAAPWIATGPDTQNYLAAEPNGNVTIQYNSNQKYFGMLWGSVDSYNTLNFYENNTLVESISGADVTSNPNGSQTANGSYFVNVDFNGNTAFNKVVATSSTPAFEFDTVATSTQVQAITPAQVKQEGPQTGPSVATVTDTVSGKVISAAPAPLPLLGATPLGLFASVGGVTLLRRGKRRKLQN